MCFVFVSHMLSLPSTDTHLHGKVECHEFTDGFESSESGTYGDPSESHLGDGRVNDSLFTKFVKESLGDLYK